MRVFKNDKERLAFLDNYRETANEWRLWNSSADLDRKWWRLDLPDGWAFVVEEEMRTITWPKVHTKWIVKHWYIVPKKLTAPFGDFVASRTQALDKLKQLDRARKGGASGKV